MASFLFEYLQKPYLQIKLHSQVLWTGTSNSVHNNAFPCSISWWLRLSLSLDLFIYFSLFKKDMYWDFPGRPVGKIPSSQCRGPGFYPWLGN